MLIKQQNLWFGWTGLEAPHMLRQVVEEIAPFFQSFSYALITASDGGYGTWLVQKFQEFQSGTTDKYHAYFLETAVVISGASFATLAITDTFFSTFDEVWFFDEYPESSPPPEIRIISEKPFPKFPSDRLNRVVEWMESSHCRLGLADGVGINFVTGEEAIVRVITNLYPDDDPKDTAS